MTPDDFSRLRESVKADEGLRLKPYKDSVGKTTIGYGRNLDDVGIRRSEAEQMLENDLTAAIAELTQTYPEVLRLNGVRQGVLANMAFNIGVHRLSQFTKMWAALARGDYHEASVEMLDSRWAKQVGLRAARLAAEMEDGVVV